MKSNLNVQAFILCWNEELMLPYTLDHYSRFCSQIVLLDNMSDDSSLEIAKFYPNVKVKRWDSGGEIRDDLYVNLKSTVYRESRGKCDWVIVCDCDEFLFGWENLESYKTEGLVAPRVVGFQMVSRFFPSYDGRPLHHLVKRGYRDPVFDKQIIFNPDIDLRYGIGAHNCNIKPQMSEKLPPLRLLHYKFLGASYVKEKNTRSFQRLSEFNRTRNLGLHYNPSFQSPEEMVSCVTHQCVPDALNAKI